jgi:hypothetical protein
MFLSEGKLLNESNLTLLHAYTLKVEDGVRNTTFNKFHFAFSQAPLNSIKSIERRVQLGHGRGNPWVYFFIPIPVNAVPCMVKDTVLLMGFDTYSKNIYFKI